MNETQSSIGEWMNQTFPGVDPESPRKSLRALEEMIELCLASGASSGDIMDSVFRSLPSYPIPGSRILEPSKIPAEAADVLIVLYGLAAMRGFDIHEEVDRKMKINRSRKWKANGDGTGYHVKEAS